mmetsp:Transcript_18900/g.27889  ORF Transcript_18900/g.27889 Transcript_18900/m.27889 type:complete len:317 (+) Transcript_18900:56-1006(+)
MSEEDKSELTNDNEAKAAEASEIAYQQQLAIQHQQYQQEQAKLDKFWNDTYENVCNIDPSQTDFKTHELPLARIKKIMRLEDDLRDEGIGRFMISGDAPIVLSKAAELFISELTLRAGGQTEENKRRTLQRHDICTAVGKVDTYDFLIDIIPRDESMQDKEHRSVKAENYPPHVMMLQNQMAQMANSQAQTSLPIVTPTTSTEAAMPNLQMQVMAAMSSRNPNINYQLQHAQMAWHQQMQRTMRGQNQEGNTEVAQNKDTLEPNQARQQGNMLMGLAMPNAESNQQQQQQQQQGFQNETGYNTQINMKGNIIKDQQ